MVDPVLALGLRLGRVASYDQQRGLGVVADDEGNEFDFHATAIADGSRAIEPGTRVSFRAAPGRRGRYEGRALTVLTSG
jgi:cold shock CspA family protein